MSAVNLLGKFAVMRKRHDSKNSKFVRLHEVIETADSEAARLCIETALALPEDQSDFYVVRLVRVYSGGRDGFTSGEVAL